MQGEGQELASLEILFGITTMAKRCEHFPSTGCHFTSPQVRATSCGPDGHRETEHVTKWP